MVKRVLVASGQNKIDEAVRKFDGYEVIGQIEFKSELNEACEFYRPDILLVGEALSGEESLIEIILHLEKEYPTMRIIYIAGYVDLRDDAKLNALGILVMAGVYDIIHERKITFQSLKNIFDEPRTAEKMSYLTRRVKESSNRSKKDSFIEFEIPEEIKEGTNEYFDNLYVVSSIKPGCGKSFISTNIATAIATYGVEKDGRKPRVALIEADLQNLSVGTLLQIEDDKKHLKAVLDKIDTIVNKNGELTGTLKETESVNQFIRSCFKPYYRVKNLEALVGSQLRFDEIENVKPYHYVYLMEAIANEFDVIIVDSNSSITHVTTFPLLHMAKNCYYVLNLDFNNVRNNVRYKDILKEMGILSKIKYILNEDIEQGNAQYGTDQEELLFTADHLNDSDFALEARIPTIPKGIFLNRLYEGKPIVLDNNDYTLKARYELLKVANQIWPIKNFKEIEEKVLTPKDKKRKGIFS